MDNRPCFESHLSRYTGSQLLSIGGQKQDTDTNTDFGFGFLPDPMGFEYCFQLTRNSNDNVSASGSQFAQDSAGRSAPLIIQAPRGLGIGRDMDLVALPAGMGLGDHDTGPTKQSIPASECLKNSNSKKTDKHVQNPRTSISNPPIAPYTNQAHSLSSNSTQIQTVVGVNTTNRDAPFVVTRPRNASIITNSLPAQNPDTLGPDEKIQWCRDVIELVERLHSAESPNASALNKEEGVGHGADRNANAENILRGGVYGKDLVRGPAQITNPVLQRLADAAVQIITDFASEAASFSGSGTVPSARAQKPPKLPPHLANALYLHATLASSGLLPALVPHNPKQAFRDFESAARNGVAAGWYRLGRDYESFRNDKSARECFKRGAKAGDMRCFYRIGMAHLLAQLGLPASPTLALPFLHRAALLSTSSFPHPAYTFALLLLDDLSEISPEIFTSFIPNGSSRKQEARKIMKIAADAGYKPAVTRLPRLLEEESLESMWAASGVTYYS